MVVLAVVVAWAVACSDDTAGEPAPATSLAGSTTTLAPSTSQALPDTSTAPAPATPSEVRFEVTPAIVRPGGTLEISGSACPPDPSWAGDDGFDFWSAVIGTDVFSITFAPRIHEPSTTPGHVSFQLVPEYTESHVAQAIPDVDGNWTAIWTVPDPLAGDDEHMIVSALCIGGSGLESG